MRQCSLQSLMHASATFSALFRVSIFSFSLALTGSPKSVQDDDKDSVFGGKDFNDLSSGLPPDESECSDAEDDVKEADRSSEGYFVLHPSNRFRQMWDVMQVVILAYLAFTVPYRVGFREPAYGVWYIVEFFVDVYFWIDLSLNFFTAYWEPGEDDDYHYVTDLAKIRKNYLRTWFVIDVLATLPVEYIARDLQGTAACSWSFETYPCPSSTSEELSPGLKRVLSVLRLLRMLRVARGGGCSTRVTGNPIVALPSFAFEIKPRPITLPHRAAGSSPAYY